MSSSKQATYLDLSHEIKDREESTVSPLTVIPVSRFPHHSPTSSILQALVCEEDSRILNKPRITLA